MLPAKLQTKRQGFNYHNSADLISGTQSFSGGAENRLPLLRDAQHAIIET